MYTEDDYFKLLGRISVLFATLDLLVTELILKIAKNESAKLDLPSETATLGTKLRFLEKAPVSTKFAMNVVNSVNSILHDAIKIADERNRYIHDQWIFDPASICEGRIDRVRLTSSGLKERTTIYITDMVKFANKIAAVQRPFFEELNNPE